MKSMNKITILALIAALALQAQALVVENEAGHLADIVTNLNIRDLTISGTVDASDFYFMSTKLHELETLNMEEATVVPCHTADRYYWLCDFPGNEIPIGAFADMNLTSVTLPSSLRTIGKAAFAGCVSLTSIKLSVSLDSIADYAFSGCSSLSVVELPARVRTVGAGAFMRCSSLTRFTVAADSRLVRMDESALMDCPALQSVSLGNSIQHLGDRLFAGSGITQLDLTASNRLSSIGEWALVNTPIAAVKMPSSLTNLGAGAFLYATDLTEAHLGGGLTAINDYMFAGTALTDFDFTGVAELGDYTLYNVDKMSVVELPATTTWLGTRAMAGMVGMTSITCHAEEVPRLGAYVWQGVDQGRIPLTVPGSSMEAYRVDFQWNKFLMDSPWIKGDVNGDGEVNIADINAVVGIILGRPADDGTRARADVNGDGEINVADINAVITIIFSPKNYPNGRLDTDDRLTLDDVDIKPGEQCDLRVKLDNAEAYSALQCDILLPQGLTLVGVGVDNGHQGKLYTMATSATRFMTYSMKQDLFDASEGIVLTISVVADESLRSEGEIVLSNIVLADNDHVAWHAANCSARVTASSAVEDLEVNADRVWVEGRTLCIESTAEGIAAIVAVNGTSSDMPLLQGVNRRPLEPGIYVVLVNGKSHKISIK